MARISVILLVFGSLLLLGASSDSRLDFAATQLTSAKDPRLRAQAALVLAALKNAQGVAPLCAALQDPSPLVRTAVARALGSLGGTGALDCLKRHRDPEPSARAEVSAAVAALEARSRPRIYVSLAKVRDPAGKLGPAVEASAERELLHALERTPGVLLAPKDESSDAANEVIRARGLKAYQLSVSLKAEANGTLSMDVLFLSYPGRTLLEDVGLGAQGGDFETLIRLLAPRAVERAAKMLEWSQP